MSEQKRDFTPSEPKKIEQQANTGILKDKEKKDLEDQIVDTLRNLNSHLTKKEIVALMNRIEISKGLEGLRSELQKEKKLENADLSDEALQDIMQLFREVEQVVSSGLEELKLELTKLNKSTEYDVDKLVYLTSRIPWIKRLEESKLGENIILDIAAIAVGAIDSAHAVLKIVLALLQDLFLLPKHAIAHLKQKKRN